MSSLLTAQEESFASAVVDEADTNGDGTVSLSELAASLGADESTLTDAFSKVDSDDDGQISATEMEAGLQSMRSRQDPPPPPSSADVALSVLSLADADGGGSLSLGEIASALGEDDAGPLSAAFAALDANGDGGLGVEELTPTVEAVFDRRTASYSAGSTAQAQAVFSMAA